MGTIEEKSFKKESFLERKFKLKENNTTIKTEVIAGVATFLATSYMIAVTPVILEQSGMDKTAAFWATALSLIVTSLLYALWVNYPFVCGPSIGVIPWFTYYVCIHLGVPWEIALGSVFISGVLFIVLSLVGFREKILMAIPMTLKHAFGAGIGAFITTVGLLNAGIIRVDGNTFFGLTLGNLTSAPTFLAILTMFLICFFIIKNIKGGFLIGILLLTVVGLFVKNPETGLPITEWSGGSLLSFSNPISALSPTFLKALRIFNPGSIFQNGFISLGIIIFTFFFIDVFDTIGTVSGLASLAGYIDPKTGDVPKIDKVFLTDAIGTVVGSLLGVPTVTTYIESSVGVAEGGRTGLTSLVIALLYILSLFFAPLFTMVPTVATGAATSVIGAMMIKSVLNIDLNDFTEALPAFFCIFMMPFTGNMGIGILIGIFTYTILKTMSGKRNEVGKVMWILSIIFVVYVVTQHLI